MGAKWEQVVRVASDRDARLLAAMSAQLVVMRGGT